MAKTKNQNNEHKKGGNAMRTHSNNRTDSLPTARHAPHQERAVMAVLRAKAPRRALSPYDAAQVADWQATTLLELAGLAGPPTPSSLISELPRVLVRTDVDLPVSGCTSWQAGRWLILINGSEPYARQRFSLAHEFKHVVDHRFRELMYVDRPGLSAAAQAEQAADYFAACLLMPRGWVKRAWAEGVQRLSELSQLFEVSPPAMARRLDHLGLRLVHDASGADEASAATYARPMRPMMRSRL
jgi:Zn-dependent peptidase ImmA (M78 family)